jgi:hypothetical protein
MNSSQAEFWQAGVRGRRGKTTVCPKLVWVYIKVANQRYQPWEYDSLATGEWTRKLLRTITRSPTPFPLKNLDLKQSLKRLDLEWLTPSQISRIRECPAPRRKQPRHPTDVLFGSGRADPRSPVRSPRCKQIFWAWRADQKTCDSHWWAASMLRVEKHNKAKKDRKRNAIQLKDAREELKRARRNRRRVKRRDEKLALSAAGPVTQSQLQSQNERADLQLLKLIRLGFEPELSDSARLDAIIKGGYVICDEVESQTYKLSGQGLQLLGQLRKRVPKV